MRRGAIATGWRARLDDALDDAGVPTVEELDGDPVHGWVGQFRVAVLCPSEAFHEEPFTETTATAARAVALTALRRAAEGQLGPDRSTATAHDVTGGGPPASLVRGVLAEPSLLRPSLTEWVRGLDRAGRAATTAAATRWMVDAIALTARRGAPQWHDPAAVGHQPPRRGVKLTASVDASRVDRGARHLLVLRGRPSETDDRLVGRIALLWALTADEEPASVVLGYRESLALERHDTHGDVIAAALEDAVADLRWAQRPSLAPVRPGPACRHCTLLADCDDGTRHVAARSWALFPTPGQPPAGEDPTM